MNDTLTLTVYGRDNCVQCQATRRWLDKNQVPYKEADLDTSPGILSWAKNQGISSAPVVRLTTQDGHVVNAWGGMRPDHLKQVADLIRNRTTGPDLDSKAADAIAAAGQGNGRTTAPMKETSR